MSGSSGAEPRGSSVDDDGSTDNSTATPTRHRDSASAISASQMSCHALRLLPGDELKGALAEFVLARGVLAGFIVTCVGSVRDVVLRLAGAESPREQANGVDDAEQSFLRTGADARFEVLSLVGTLSPSGLHLHASLGDEKGAVCGGHLVRATVHTTAEIVVGEASALAFTRVMDVSTGFKELEIADRPPGIQSRNTSRRHDEQRTGSMDSSADVKG